MSFLKKAYCVTVTPDRACCSPCSDSMSKDLFKALRCFMIEFTDLKTYHASNNFTAMHYLDSLPGFGEPHCMHMPHHTRICQVRGQMHSGSDCDCDCEKCVTFSKQRLCGTTPAQWVALIDSWLKWPAHCAESYSLVFMIKDTHEHGWLRQATVVSLLQRFLEFWFRSQQCARLCGCWLVRAGNCCDSYLTAVVCIALCTQVHAIQGDLFVAGNRTKIGVLPLLQESLGRSQDILIVNFGLWHGETRQEDYRQNLHQLGKFYQATKGNFSNLFWMETPKQHFDSADGDYKVAWIGTRKGPWQCQAIKGVSMKSDWSVSATEGDAVAEYVMQGSWRNIMAREILQQQYDVPILPVYNSTVTAAEYHRQNFDGQECSHYCHPSLPQLWLYMLKQTLQKYKVTPLTDVQYKEVTTVRKRWPGCASVLDRDEAKLGGPRPVDHVVAQLRKQHQTAVAAKPTGFWGWLRSVFGSGAGSQQQQLKVELLDGIAVLRHHHSSRAAKASSSSGSGGQHQIEESYSHSATLRPWENLALLLGHQPEQQQQQKRRRQQGQGV